MKIDVRKPTIVMLGAWNPAVFHPGWMGLNIFGIPAGTQIRLRVLKNMSDGKEIVFIEGTGVGYYVDNSRFEIYPDRSMVANLETIGGVVQKIVELLPHTPFGDIGVNFLFFEDEPDVDLLDKLTSNDRLDNYFDIIAEEIISHIREDASCQLNFKRVSSADQVQFDFNYHHSVSSLESIHAINPARIRLLFDKSKNHIRNIYHVEGDEEVWHQPPENEENHVG